MQWDMKVDSLEVAESLGWLGQALGPCEVNGFKTTRFEVRGSLGIVVQKKGSRGNAATFEDYFGRPLPADACLPELQEEFMKEIPTPCQGPRSLGRESTSSGEFNLGDMTDLFDKTNERDDLLDLEAMSDSSEVLAQWPGPASSASIEQCDSRGCESGEQPTAEDK